MSANKLSSVVFDPWDMAEILEDEDAVTLSSTAIELKSLGMFPPQIVTMENDEMENYRKQLKKILDSKDD